MNHYKILILSIVIFCGFGISAQNIKIDINAFKTTSNSGYDSAVVALKRAEKFFDKEDFESALGEYLKAELYNPDYPELNYKIGQLFLQSKSKKSALSYFLKVKSSKPELTPFLDWQLGQAYHYNENYVEALNYYKKFRNYIKEKGASTAKVEKRIDECQSALRLAELKKDMQIKNLTILNSEADDYAPLISTDKSTLIFTSRRAGGTGTLAKDGKPYEDVYLSEYKQDTWITPKNLSKPVNTEFHDATVGISPDGQELFLYHGSDIFYTRLEGETWAMPKPMPAEINSAEVENSACFSYDGKEIFFVRGKHPNPEKSNSDIYVSTFKDGKWTKAIPISDKINTPEDEDGVFMHPDGKTLYFSSKGHNTVGGFDIFKTQKDEKGKWQKPENLGFPLNTPEDDLFFVMAADGKTGYYSTVKSDGKGGMDLYQVDFEPTKTDTIQIDTTTVKTVYLTIVKGIVTDGKTKLPLEAEIEIVDNDSSIVILNSKSNSATGKYLVSLPSGRNYGMEVKREGYLFHSENFDVPATEGYQEIIKNIELFPIAKDVKVVLRNIFFDTDKSVLRPESYTELNKLKDLLEKNPTLSIEISGHTDNQGSYSHNQTLSQARAQSVVNYLIENKIDKSRLSARGASWDEPIDSNTTKAGRQNNRRVEFKILE